MDIEQLLLRGRSPTRCGLAAAPPHRRIAV
jgi:hypothetical protein